MSSSLLMHESLQEYPIVMHVAHTFLLLFVSILRRHRYTPVSVGHQPSAAASDKAKTQQKMKVSSEGASSLESGAASRMESGNEVRTSLSAHSAALVSSSLVPRPSHLPLTTAHITVCRRASYCLQLVCLVDELFEYLHLT